MGEVKRKIETGRQAYESLTYDGDLGSLVPDSNDQVVAGRVGIFGGLAAAAAIALMVALPMFWGPAATRDTSPKADASRPTTAKPRTGLARRDIGLPDLSLAPVSSSRVTRRPRTKVSTLPSLSLRTTLGFSRRSTLSLHPRRVKRATRPATM